MATWCEVYDPHGHQDHRKCTAQSLNTSSDIDAVGDEQAPSRLPKTCSGARPHLSRVLRRINKVEETEVHRVIRKVHTSVYLQVDVKFT